MVLTITVMIPRGPMASSILSAHPMDKLRNCLVTCSPNRVSKGARSLKRLFENSSPANSVLVGAPPGAVDVGAMRRGPEIDKPGDGRMSGNSGKQRAKAKEGWLNGDDI